MEAGKKIKVVGTRKIYSLQGDEEERIYFDVEFWGEIIIREFMVKKHPDGSIKTLSPAPKDEFGKRKRAVTSFTPNLWQEIEETGQELMEKSLQEKAYEANKQ